MTDRVATLSAMELAAEIERTRLRMSRTLAALDRDYALRHLLVRGERALRGADFHLDALKQAAKDNAVPATLIGLGLAWLALTERDSAARLRQGIAVSLSRLQQLLDILPHPKAGAPEALGVPGRPAAAPMSQSIPSPKEAARTDSAG